MPPDAFDRAAAAVLGDTEKASSEGANGGAAPNDAPAEPPRRRRGRPPIHGRYSQKSSTRNPPPPNDDAPPDAPAPQFDPAQLGHAVRGMLEKIADLTTTQPPHPKESEAIGAGLAYGLERTTVGIEQSGPWTPLLMAVGLYTVPRAMEYGFRWLDERKRRAELEREQGAGDEAPARSTFRRVAEAASPSAPLVEPDPPAAPPVVDTGVPAMGLRATR